MVVFGDGCNVTCGDGDGRSFTREDFGLSGGASVIADRGGVSSGMLRADECT